MEGKALRKKTNLTLAPPDGRTDLTSVWEGTALHRSPSPTPIPSGKRVKGYQETDIRRSHSPGPRLGGFRGKP